MPLPCTRRNERAGVRRGATSLPGGLGSLSQNWFIASAFSPIKPDYRGISPLGIHSTGNPRYSPHKTENFGVLRLAPQTPRV